MKHPSQEETYEWPKCSACGWLYERTKGCACAAARPATPKSRMTLDDLEADARSGRYSESRRAEDVILDLIRRVREAERAKASFRVAVTNELAFAGHEIERLRAERDTALARLAEVERERDEARADFLECARAVGLVHQQSMGPDIPGDASEVASIIRGCVAAADELRHIRWCEQNAPREPDERVVLEAARDKAARHAMHRRAQAAESRATKAERANATLQVRLDGALRVLREQGQAFLQEACDVRAEVSECAQCGPRAEAAMEAVRAAIASVEAPKEEARTPEVTDALAKYTAEYAGITEDDLAWMADAPPSDGGARQMDEAITRREARIAELEARAEAAEAKLALVRDLALSGERSSWRRDVLAILGGES